MRAFPRSRVRARTSGSTPEGAPCAAQAWDKIGRLENGWQRNAVAAMTPVHLFNVISQHNRWLSVRQATIAGNIANANTPGYKALDVEPFEKGLEATRLTMNATQPGHVTDEANRATAVE